MLILQGLVFFVIYYFVFRAVIVAFNLKTPGREDASEDEERIQPSTNSGDTTTLAQKYLDIIGGKENIVNIDACITRLRLTVNDSELVDEAAAKALGAAAVIKLNKTTVQIIVGTQAESIANKMKAL